jgi:hypothetical protein
MKTHANARLSLKGREPPLDVGCVRPRVVEKRRECFGQRPASTGVLARCEAATAL